ncbi:unnamed protein product [Hydatigera taeniaeformis]|uniref:EF-hand domain-containing protein n=1 Tax=Hydatigena taeniaeformis TaxID=6205 RepID=A0A158RF65_HYDTA|nr:unnamed protein product [Hydatigera taeniaeformis]
MFDPKGTGFVRRDDVCNALHWYPNEPGFLGDVEVLANDMSQRKRESVIKIILTALATKKPKKEKLRMVKKKLDALYGSGWNVYIAEGRYWAVCSHKPGSNLTFIYHGRERQIHENLPAEDYSDSQATYKRMSTIGNADCSTLLRYFDELNESTNRVLTTDFRNHLLRWGIPKDTVENYMPRFDPKKTGYITRKDLCSALNYYPNEPSFLKDVYIIESDAPQHQRESIIKIILEEMKHGGHPKAQLIIISMESRQKASDDKFTPAFLLHLYDELIESQPSKKRFLINQATSKRRNHLSTNIGPRIDATLKDYENFLVLWGMDRKQARGRCSQISSHKNERFTREELCKGLGFLPEQPAGLREVEILCRDMPIRKSESIQVIVLNALNSNSSKKDVVAEIKREVENIYGPQWNVFIANGHYWAVCTHRPGGNLVFSYQGVVYGVYHSPERCADDSNYEFHFTHPCRFEPTNKMERSAQPEKLVHLYDELTESQIGNVSAIIILPVLPGISTKTYHKYLLKWGIDEGVASRICSSIDPTGKGTITREALCDTLKCWPNQPAILRDVEVIESDMSSMKRESIILLMLEVVSERRQKKETIEEIRRRLEKVYGEGWSCYIAEGRFWSVCAHRQGSNLAFVYKKMVYGVFQTPLAK